MTFFFREIGNFEKTFEKSVSEAQIVIFRGRMTSEMDSP